MNKFKPGDKVRCVDYIDDSKEFTNGKEYVVKQFPDAYGYLCVELDDVGNTRNGLNPKYFVLVEPKKENKMISYLVLNDSLVVSFNGKSEVLNRSDSRYDDVLECIREGRLDDIPVVLDIAHGFKDSGIELKDGVLYEGESAIPTELNERILAYKDARLPYDSLLKFWENLKKNPSFNSRKMLFAFLENNGHPITEDGCFIAYRGVGEDFKDKHTGKWDNTPGSVCEMPRSEVDENPNHLCAPGLHVACFEYAKSFGEKLVEVKVNPEHVVAVPTDYNGTKMRVCRFEVIQECENIRTELLYGQPVEESEVDEQDDSEDFEDNDNECLNCGEERQDDHEYCPHCGHEHFDSL